MYQSRWAPQVPAEETQAESTTTLIHTTVPPITDLPPSVPAESLSEATAVQEPAPVHDYAQASHDLYPDDAFAQTGAQQDDLFDDVNPVEEESMRLRSDDDLFNDDFTPAPEVEAEPVRAVITEPLHPASTQPTRARGDGHRGRGRGSSRGGQGDSKENTRAARAVQSGDGKPSSTNSAPEGAPSGPRKETISAVRGDRQATGGIRKPKLTSEELAEKMAKIQIKNASLTAAHDRAEADAASFAEREQVAKQVAEQRRKEERRDRQQMMGERERNRQRKLKAMEGREWDAGKREEDYAKGGRSDKAGGFAGDQEGYTDGREYLLRESRGGGGGRGSRRGGKEGRQHEQNAPKGEDFPALPTATKDPSEVKTSTIKSNITKPDHNTSWADQMESNTAS